MALSEIEDLYPSMKPGAAAGVPAESLNRRTLGELRDKKDIPKAEPSASDRKLESLYTKYGKLLAVDPRKDSERLKRIFVQELEKEIRATIPEAEPIKIEAVVNLMKKEYGQSPSIPEFQRRFIENYMKVETRAPYHLRELQRLDEQHEKLKELYPKSPQLNALTPTERAANAEGAVLDSFDPPDVQDE